MIVWLYTAHSFWWTSIADKFIVIGNLITACSLHFTGFSIGVFILNAIMSKQTAAQPHYTSMYLKYWTDHHTSVTTTSTTYFVALKWSITFRIALVVRVKDNLYFSVSDKVIMSTSEAPLLCFLLYLSHSLLKRNLSNALILIQWTCHVKIMNFSKMFPVL